MYCKECGSKLDKDSKFCDNCGKKIDYKLEVPNDEVNQNSKVTSPLTISISKLVVLSVVTFGLYEIYWFYKQWKTLKDIKNLKITAWARGLFAPLFAYSLFKQYFELTRRKTHKEYPSAGWLAIVYFISISLWKLPDPYWLISFMSVLPLVPVQNAINDYWQDMNQEVEISSPGKP